jgi:hypothetical protein
MLIDCDTCAVRGTACAGCMMSAMLDAPAPVERLDPEERRAIEVFARAGFDVQLLASSPARRAAPRHRVGRRRHVA